MRRQFTQVVETCICVIALGILACTRNDHPVSSGPSSGTLVIATTGDADILFPPLVTLTTGREVTELIYDYLADVGQSMNTIGDQDFRPVLAKSWTWSPDSLSIAFHLNPEARWHDGKKVTADDVAFTYTIYNDSLLGSSNREQLTNVASVTATDSLTATFHFKKRDPLQFFNATNQMQILPKHIFGGMTSDSLRKVSSIIKPVGSGKYRFVSWKPKESIELTADTTNYRGAPKIRRLIWSYTPSAATAATRLLAGEVDVYDVMRPENVKEASSHPNVRIISAPSTDYVFLDFNLRDGKRQDRPNPIFASRELRRALTMAVDIPSMVRNVFDTLALPGIGPTIRAYPTTDTTIVLLPHDPARAARILDSLGWRSKTPDGIRERNGRKLQFKILVPTSSINRQRMAVLLQSQLRKIGVDAFLDEIDSQTFNQRFGDRDYDAAMGTWHLGTSAASVNQLWTTTAAKDKSGYNTGFYSSPVFDAYVDSAISSFESAKSRYYYRKAYETAIADAPAIWLYEPRLVIGVHKRIQTGPIRPDAWWSSIPDWSIRAQQQIDRDRIR